jgi:tRNA 2-thiouridine synthesizing protein A
MTRVLVDTRPMLCPLPVIRVQDRVRELPPGTLIEAICSDPGVLYDIPAWCRVNGHRVLETRTQDHTYIIVLEVGPI